MQTNLFDSTPGGYDSSTVVANLLPKDGSATYIPNVFDSNSCSMLSASLRATLDWQQDQLFMFGKLITTKREVAWVGDAGCSYTYSGVKKFPQAWTPELLRIKHTAEALAHHTFNSCLLNLYHDGDQSMGWHSDDEIELEQSAPIASVSFGGGRKFSFKHKFEKLGASVLLENGSVLLMHAPTQNFWQHSLTKTKRIVPPRINLTFRAIRQEQQ
ncbi:MAG: alpha-ketoglutarate-dependent dioxygenase AlkB [Alcaligenaceae bacterium]|nr:MAG: alpha-ketoglutarate-dependent dioxygenase AlkB [Alcaligenaceae bacterium]